MNTIAAELFAEIARIPCVNSHSHLPPEHERLAQDVDALVLFKHAYLHADLVTAGMPAAAREKVFSVATPMAVPPSARIFAAVASAPSALRSAATTDAPAPASTSAVAAPMPLAAPVMTATRPDRS